MNRLLQHFVDSGGAQGAPASRPPIPSPPQSSGGSYHAGNRGSYQRAAPGGPFYYQPPPQQAQPHWQQQSDGRSGLEEIPLTSQSSGGMYETVDLNADSSQQHRPPQLQHQQHRLFRPPSTPNSQSFNTPPGSREKGRTPFYQQKTPGSTGSASELFANDPPPAKELFGGGGPPSGGSASNPYRRQSNVAASPANANGGNGMFGNTTPQKDPFAAANGGAGAFGHHAAEQYPFAAPPADNVFGNNASPAEDPFAASTTPNGGGVFGQTQNDPFAAPHSEENRNVFGNGASTAGGNAHDPFAAQPPKDTGFRHEEQAAQKPQQQHQSANPFALTPSQSGSSPFELPAPSNGGHERMGSADSLFSAPAPTNNADWSHSAPPAHPSTQSAPSTPGQAHELFASDASSLFGGDAPSPFQQQNHSFMPASPQTDTFPSPTKPQDNISPSPANFPVNAPPSSMKPPVAPPSPMKPPVAPPSPMINASSPPMRPHVAVPASPVMRPEDHLAPAFGSMKLSAASKSPLKSGLDVRSMKFPASKREDDAVSNAPSIAPSRMSMLSTLDDSLKLSDMYKQMTARLEGEKQDLLRVVASQAQEIAQMKKHIKSLELQLKKSRPQDA